MPDVRAGLVVRVLADKTRPQYDPNTGERLPWPVAGLRLETDTPRLARVPTSWVDRGRSEGWISVEGATVAHRPSGPAANPWAGTPHTFQHYDVIILRTVDGDLRYRVTHQPDKYAEHGDDSTPVTDSMYAAGETRVDWFYDIDLED